MLKDDPLAELMHAIHLVASGGTYLSAALRGVQSAESFLSVPEQRARRRLI
jgi:DNA-binding NarL/FixJ family response regulator